MTNGGNPISAYYSSTAGGYVYSSSNSISSRPWTKDAQDGSGAYNNFSDVRNNAYDKNSPWFYCDWGARSAYGGTAWLKGEEVADIANVSDSPHAGAITAALFLQEFVTPDIAWAHLDIMAWNAASRPGRPEGGEALALRALFALVAERFPASMSG